MEKPIVLLTDFGHQDGYVGIMKGVIHGIHPAARVIDLAHDLPPQSIDAARFILWNSYKYFPEGSIFVCVVDPGVGSERKIHVYQTQKHIFVVPDNGVLDFVLAEQSIRYAFELEHPSLRLGEISNTFHGRDLFAPAAAHLARDFVITQVGPSLQGYQIPPSPFIDPEESQEGRVIHIDRYGNLITNFQAPAEQGLVFSLADRQILSCQTYAAVEEGDFLALRGSHGLWELACRNGNLAEKLQAGYGTKVKVIQRQ